MLTMLLLLAVFGVSFVLTMVGLGGGLVYSPMLFMLGFAKADAAAASLFMNLVAVASAAMVYARKRMVDYSLSLPLIVSSAAMAPVGAVLNRHVSTDAFVLVLAVILALAAARMFWAPAGIESGVDQTPRWKKIGGGIAIGLVIGLLGGLLGIGGGVFVVPLLIFVLRTPVKIAAASSTFIVCFSSLTGFAGYAWQGGIDWGFVLPAGAACFLGGQTGARYMSARMKGRGIRLVFAGILAFMAVKLLHRALL